MFGRKQQKLIGNAIGLLARLRRDKRGNALAMMAAMMVPLAGLTGSAIDMGRLYAVKSRLQQACDAGVLAGRKQMTDTSSTTLDSAATSAAQSFFANNISAKIGTVNGSQTYSSSWFQITNLSFTPTKPDNYQVSATASATVPMTIMKMFGFNSKTINVTCMARYDVADSDIMFVLDTTGSMACLTSDSQSTCDSYAANASNITTKADGTYAVTEKSNSRISGVRAAVLNFYDTVTAQAEASNSNSNFRFGFVPYNATVNVGKLLQPMGYIASSWTYQSRSNTGVDGNYQSATSSTASGACSTNGSTRSPATGYNSSGTATVTTTSTSNGKCTTTTQVVGPAWKYQPVTYSVSQYILGSAVDNPAEVSNATSTWAGCIEERGTIQNLSSPSATSPPLDLDVDTAPSASTANSFWGPQWQDVEFARLSTNEVTGTYRNITMRPSGSTMVDTYAKILNELPCPLGASRLSSMTLAAGWSSGTKANLRSQIQTYLSAANGFTPYGVTYHDVGMTWGTRMISPTGIFAADTAAWTGHNAPNRFIIFLTDGAMETDPNAYASHGMETYDQRVTSNMSNLTTYHNARFTTACQIAKNHNITVFVIAFAQTLTTQLSACASPGQAYYASDATGLNTAFSNIAKQVAMLRLTK